MSPLLAGVVRICLGIILVLAIFSKNIAVNGIHLKIPISGLHANRIQRQAIEEVTSCTDKVEVNRSSLSLTGWLSMLNQRVLFYRSLHATQNINTVTEMGTVPGLINVTASDVLRTMRTRGCPVYIFGGFIRDQFLGASSNDVDAEVDCEISTVLDICQDTWGNSNCRINREGTIAHVGNPEVLDFSPTNMTFYGSPCNLEYTANSLAYDTNGNEIVLDLSGSGVVDVCSRKIRIPSEDISESGWDSWKTESKIYRYWKLRIKNFTAFDSATSSYVITSAKTMINSQSPKGFGFKTFYCEKVFGLEYSPENNACKSPLKKTCDDNKGKENKYSQVISEDLGGDYVRNTLMLPNCNGVTLCSHPSKLFCGATVVLILFINII